MNKETWINRLPSDWREPLEKIYEKGEIASIFSTLKERAKETEIFPNASQLWRPFKECNYAGVKIIIIGESTYERKEKLPLSDGLFLSSYTSTMELDVFFQQMEVQAYDGLKLDIGTETNLSLLARQGVLLYSISPTTEIGEMGAHKKIWKPFIISLIDNVLNGLNRPLLYLLIGKHARSLKKHILPFDVEIVEAESLWEAARDHKVWNSNGFFTKANEFLLSNYSTSIMWDINEPLPF